MLDTQMYLGQIGRFRVLRDSKAGRVLANYIQNFHLVGALQESEYPFPDILLDLKTQAQAELRAMKPHVGDPAWGFVPTTTSEESTCPQPTRC